MEIYKEDVTNMANIYDDDDEDSNDLYNEQKKKQEPTISTKIFTKNYDVFIENITDHINNGLYVTLKFLYIIPFIFILYRLYYGGISLIVICIISLIYIWIINNTVKTSKIFKEKRLKYRLEKGHFHIYIDSVLGYSQIVCELRNGKKEIFKIKKATVSKEYKEPQVELTNKGINVFIPYSAPIRINLSEEEQES